MVPDDEAPPIIAINPHKLIIETKPPPLDRGVFTASGQTIPAGTLIEESPVLVINQTEWDDHACKTVLEHYAFIWGKQGKMALALGMGESLDSSLWTPLPYFFSNASSMLPPHVPYRYRRN